MSPYRVDARLSGRHPFELYFLFVCLLVGLPTVLGIVPEPGSIRATLTGWVSFGWSMCLLFGAVVSLLGIYWKTRARGLILEQLGLGVLGVTSLIYAVCIFYFLGIDSLAALAMIAGWGVACLRRYLQIQQVIDTAVEVNNKRSAS